MLRHTRGRGGEQGGNQSPTDPTPRAGWLATSRAPAGTGRCDLARLPAAVARLPAAVARSPPGAGGRAAARGGARTAALVALGTAGVASGAAPRATAGNTLTPPMR